MSKETAIDGVERHRGLAASATPSPPAGAGVAVASVSVVAMMAIGIITKRFIVPPSVDTCLGPLLGSVRGVSRSINPQTSVDDGIFLNS